MPHARTRGERCRCRGSARCGHARTLSDRGSCPRCSSNRTSGERNRTRNRWGACWGGTHRQAFTDPAGAQREHARLPTGPPAEPTSDRRGEPWIACAQEGNHYRHADLRHSSASKRWHYPDPFDPTRFAAENEAKISRYQYLPFGAGPRICIGMAFAMIEATAMLATILQAARFETVDDYVPIPIARVTLHPKGGMPLKVWVE